MRFETKQHFSVMGVIAAVLGIILIVAVAVPITQDVISAANLSGTDAIIGGVLTTLLLVGAIVVIARMYSD